VWHDIAIGCALLFTIIGSSELKTFSNGCVKLTNRGVHPLIYEHGSAIRPQYKAGCVDSLIVLCHQRIDFCGTHRSPIDMVYGSDIRAQYKHGWLDSPIVLVCQRKRFAGLYIKFMKRVDNSVNCVDANAELFALHYEERTTYLFSLLLSQNFATFNDARANEIAHPRNPGISDCRSRCSSCTSWPVVLSINGAAKA